MFRPRLWTNTSIKLAWRVFMSTVRQQNTVQSHKIKNHLLHRKNMDYIAILLYKTHDIPRCHLNQQLAGHNTSAMDDLAYCELYDPCRILPTLSRNHTFQNKTWTLKKAFTFYVGTAARKSRCFISGAKSHLFFGRVVASCWVWPVGHTATKLSYKIKEDPQGSGKRSSKSHEMY